MKILKIEIQNINSLKSETPILIDFENEHFKDVGLYAITGSTGAGKTTILDAITIALYHNVPRFNGKKGSLLDVVSHGAPDAFSRITFENDNITYEAFWSIRVADKKGKIYKNPKEEVSLKNLSSSDILATQKRELINQVHTVTRLDYNQFLRSVMLAQGEFAAFLTAKGPDKGKLLEQITGEKIYKKIGQGILDRKALEEKKLESIQSKINDTDVLNEEAKTELKNKDKSLDNEITKVETAVKTTLKIADWYVKPKELQNEALQLVENSKDIDAYIEKHKNELNLLTLNEKAEPFKEIIQNFNRTEKERNQKEIQLKKVTDELIELKPKIESIQKEKEKDTKNVEEANATFTAWLPKFDVITKIENQLKNDLDDKQNASEKLTVFNKEIETSNLTEKDLTKSLAETNTKIAIAETFLDKNKALKDIDVQISTWTQNLTTLKANKKSLQEDSEFIVLKNKEITSTTVLLKEDETTFNKKIAEIEKVENEYTTISEQLTKNNLTDILAQKKDLALKEANWKQFKNLSEQTIKATKELSDLERKKKTFTTSLESVQQEIISLKKDLETQEKLVADASKILDLEKSKAKYEHDRQHLIPGKPCGLCGSKEHPYSENLKTIDISTAEKELNIRKEKQQVLLNSKSEFEKKEVQFLTDSKNITKQMEDVTKELHLFTSEAKKLNIKDDLNAIVHINSELNRTTEQLKTLDATIKVAQDLQLRKNQLSEEIQNQNKTVNALKTAVATRKEKLKNISTEIDTMQKSVGNSTEECGLLEADLKESLGKFNYKVPTVENTDVFIQNIEASISNYTKTQQEFNNLKSQHTVLANNLNNHKKQHEVKTENQKELLKTVAHFQTEILSLQKQRTTILPQNVSVSDKRTLLQESKNKLTRTLEIRKNDLQKLLDTKTAKKVLHSQITKEKETTDQVLITLQATLNSQIEHSNFTSKEMVEKALLTEEDKLSFTKSKERIKENELQLRTLRDANLKATNTLNTAKNFEISEVENKTRLETLQNQRKEFTTEKGKIVEAFRKDKEIRNRNKETYKKIDLQESVCVVWRDLYKLIGNSKDAFNDYVQRLTLKHLLELANVHLYNLNKRYSLKLEDNYKLKEELNFNLIDHYQTDQERLVNTSSGGEKFIISLALALGLSDLASKNVKIDSLFIDEGFGTLDKNTLETVISTLETLQSQGKTIGVISHVENLKERISTQIKVTKKSNGVSTVTVS